MKPLFDAAEEMKELQVCENCYQRGEMLFEKEHNRYFELSGKLEKEGYTVERLESLKTHYRSEIALVREKEKAVAKEERIAKRILNDLMAADGGREPLEQKVKDREENKTKQKNSVR